MVLIFLCDAASISQPFAGVFQSGGDRFVLPLHMPVREEDIGGDKQHVVFGEFSAAWIMAVYEVDEGGELVGVGHARRLSALRTLGKVYFLHCILFFLR